MQTGCPKCRTIVRANHGEWKILNAGCPELAGTQWAGKPEYCPVLTIIAEPDVTLPGVAIRATVQSQIERIRPAAPAHEDLKQLSVAIER